MNIALIRRDFDTVRAHSNVNLQQRLERLSHDRPATYRR